MNANATVERLKEQLKEKQHKINLYHVETESLIKQIDQADAKTREKEDELKLMEVDYDRKMKLQEERILYRRGKNDERQLYEVKRNHDIKVDELHMKIGELNNDIDYHKKKIDKLEVENKQLRLGGMENKRIKELHNECEMLRVQLDEAVRNGGQGQMD